MLILERVGGFANRVLKSRAGLWVADQGIVVPRFDNIIAVLGRPLRSGGVEKRLFAAANIVTDAGDIWYAQKATGETPTNTFNRHAMASARTGSWTKSGATSQYGNATVISGSSKANDGTYPKTDDDDTDNTDAGANVVTHRVSYTTGDFNGTIVAGLFHDSGQTAGGSPLLTGYDFAAPFDKEATDTLKVFVNHEIVGA